MMKYKTGEGRHISYLSTVPLLVKAGTDHRKKIMTNYNRGKVRFICKAVNLTFNVSRFLSQGSALRNY